MEWLPKISEIREMTITEIAWLAATIDGEGSIGLYNYGKEGRRVQIQMANTNEAFVQRMRDIIGCGSSIMRTKIYLSHKGRKPMFQYSLKGSIRCYWVLKQILPFLIIKKEKAELIIKELESKPFGRWANKTQESKQKQSERMKEIWRVRKQQL